MLECDEVGTIFPVIRDLNVILELKLDPRTKRTTFCCPSCRNEGISGLNLATSDQIINAGIKTSEYE
jgi:hypothetical protein